jgi:hypothetical protein
MSVLRTIFATFLALLASLIVIGQINLIRDQEPMHVLEKIGPFITAFCLVASSFYYFRPRAYWDLKLACSHCHHRGSLRLSALGQPRISILAWILGGIVGSLLYSHARKHRFHCESCGEVCDLRTVGGWLAAVWLLLLVFLIAVAIYVHGGG